jgi:cytosine/adenosine deaminase-related metal-dependent hydrolase
MRSFLLHRAAVVATMDDNGRELVDGWVLVEDNLITAVGSGDELPPPADGPRETIDARGMVLLPGLINTHHHFTQSLTRAVPAAQNADLFTWLRTLYPIWGRLTPEAVRVSTGIALAELLLSGCTTASDHTYIWPNGARVDDQIEAAIDMGVRFHAARGSMSVGESQGGLPPDTLVEDESGILADSRRVIETFHDDAPGAMIRIVLAPCSPFSVSPDLMRESVALARSYGVHSHTHLAETRDEHDYCLSRYGRTPVELCEDLTWMGDDVWHAHVVHPSEAEVVRMGASRTGAAHCPTSNMRLGSGMAPVGSMQTSGMRVGLGVDGSASNDGAHLLTEARMAMLLQRVGGQPAAMSAREALALATRGGAEVLGRNDIGMLAPGMMADIIGIRVDTLPFAGGGVHDPVAALVFCQPPNVDFSMVNGVVRVVEGRIVGFDLGALVERHNDIARAMLRDEIPNQRLW